MKILLLNYSLSSGGGERFTVDLCNRFAENPQDEVIFLQVVDDRIGNAGHYLPDLSKKVRYINLEQPSGLTMGAYLGVYRMIKAEMPDVVHCQADATLIFLPALRFGKKIRFVHTLHNLAHKTIRFPRLRGLYKWFYKHRIQAVVISNECEKSFEDFYGFPAVQINNGREPLQTTVDYDIVRKEIESRKASDNTKVFVMVARVNEAKNQPRLFNTFERLVAESADCVLVVLGAGYDKAGYIAKYADIRQIYIAGERRNVGDYVACADYFVLSSDWEGLPLSLLEAMSMGVIPVCTPAGGVGTVIENGVNGYMCEHCDDEEFYHMVKAVLHELETVSSEAVKKCYEDSYSMKVCAERYYEMYRDCYHKA